MDVGVAITQQYAGKTVLITGGGSGIGQAAALLFARAGANVVVADVNDEAGEATVRHIKEQDSQAIFVRTDVTQATDVEALVAHTVATFGRLDCAFNNAGISGEECSTVACTEDNWDRVLSINLKGIWLCMKYEIAHMLRQSSGAIVNSSSISGLIALRGWPAYVASKHGIIGLTKVAALENCQAGIRINAICPGVIETPMLAGSFRANPAAKDALAALEQIGRMGAPEEVAEAVLWLCSDAASFVLGSCLSVDDGFVAQ